MSIALKSVKEFAKLSDVKRTFQSGNPIQRLRAMRSSVGTGGA